MTNNEKAELAILLMIYRKPMYAKEIVDAANRNNPQVQEVFSSLLNKSRVETVTEQLADRKLVEAEESKAKTSTGKKSVTIYTITPQREKYLFSSLNMLMSLPEAQSLRQ